MEKAHAASKKSQSCWVKTGTVKIKLREDVAPNHVERIKTLIGEQFYDGIIFHRVIDGFMAQTGDPTGTGMGGPTILICALNFPANRLSAALWAWRVRNIPTAPIASSSSALMMQQLNGQYTVFGEVTEGMEHIDAIAKGEPPADPDKIISMRLKTKRSCRSMI